MIVGIIGSKDQLVNEYRVMLAEKLLNKSEYDIDAEIRTLELLKVSGQTSEFEFSIVSNQSHDVLENRHLYCYMIHLDLHSQLDIFIIFRFILGKAACRNVK